MLAKAKLQVNGIKLESDLNRNQFDMEKITKDHPLNVTDGMQYTSPQEKS